MKGLFVACVSLIVLAGRAAADDVIATKAPAIPYAGPSGYNWSGFYAGGRVGYAWGTSNWTSSTPGAPNVSGALDLFQPLDAFTDTGSFSQGLQAGYNYMLPNRILIGAEADVTFPGFPECRRHFHRRLVKSVFAHARGGDIQRDRPDIRHRARPHRLCSRQLAVLRNGRIRLDL